MFYPSQTDLPASEKFPAGTISDTRIGCRPASDASSEHVDLGSRSFTLASHVLNTCKHVLDTSSTRANTSAHRQSVRIRPTFSSWSKVADLLQVVTARFAHAITYTNSRRKHAHQNAHAHSWVTSTDCEHTHATSHKGLRYHMRPSAERVDTRCCTSSDACKHVVRHREHALTELCRSSIHVGR